MGDKKIQLLIVDDSETIRSFLTKIFTNSGQIEILDSVGDAQKAASIVVKKRPDVIILDITMPGIDGLTFLEKLMKNYPTPVVMFSSYTSDGSYATETALKIGAVDYLPKPVNSSLEEYEALSNVLIKKIVDASKKTVNKLDSSVSFENIRKKITEDVKKEKDRLISKYGEAIETTDKIILIGSSTGGPDALSKILDKLPSKIPPIIIVQHMPSSYTKTWAGRLNAIYDFEVKEAEDNEEVTRNKVYIAQGGKHIELKYFGKKAIIMINDSPPLHSCKPSVDILFNSIKDEELAKRCISIILTGMGRDGADGMLNLKNLGSYTIAQDKNSCLIYGMPKAAFDINAVCEELDIDKMAYRILEKL